MKKFIKVLIGVAVAVVAASQSYAASVDTSGIGLSGPQGLDNPPYWSRTWRQTNNWPASGVTNGTQIILTNVYVNVYPDQGVGGVLTVGQLTSGAVFTTNSSVLYADLSFDGGRSFTTTRPLSMTFTPSLSNAPNVIPFFIPYTNFAAAQIVRFTAFSNTVPAGAVNYSRTYLSNMVVGTHKPAQWGR